MNKAEAYLDVAALIDALVSDWRKDAEDAARGTLRSPHDSRYARYADGGEVIARHLRKLAADPIDEIRAERERQTLAQIAYEANPISGLSWEQFLASTSPHYVEVRTRLEKQAAAVARRCAEIARETASDVLGDGAYKCADMAGHRKHVCDHVAHEIVAEIDRLDRASQQER